MVSKRKVCRECVFECHGSRYAVGALSPPAMRESATQTPARPRETANADQPEMSPQFHVVQPVERSVFMGR